MTERLDHLADRQGKQGSFYQESPQIQLNNP